MGKKFVKCQCNTRPMEQREEIVDSATGETKAVEGEFVYGPCGADTRGTFAPGHDAQLKGLLLKLIRSGQGYWVNEGGFLVYMDPATELANRGWGHFNVAPKARKASKKAAKVNDAPKAGFHPVRVKIGRWVKDANVISESENSSMVEFTNAKGAKVLQQVKRSALVEG